MSDGQDRPIGQIDESERKFSSEERAIAEFLVQEGKNIKALAEGTRTTRSADADVDGVHYEFKTLDAGATDATVKNTINNSIRRGGQTRDMIVDARKSGLNKSDALLGLRRSKGITRGKVDSVRVIGDSYDIISTDFD